MYRFQICIFYKLIKLWLPKIMRKSTNINHISKIIILDLHRIIQIIIIIIMNIDYFFYQIYSYYYFCKCFAFHNGIIICAFSPAYLYTTVLYV